MEAAPPASANVGTLHRRVTLIAGLAFASNGLTLGIISYALLGLKASWGLFPRQVGWLTMAAGAGQLCGGVLMGYLADWIGRRVGYGATVALSSLATGAAAFAPSLPWLVPLLFLTGVGFGGVAPIATSLVGEFAPPSQRGAMMGWTQVIWVLGYIVAAIGGVVLAHGTEWRLVFALGFIPLALAVVGPWLVPESPRFLLAHGRRREAEALTYAMAVRFGTTPDLPMQERAGRVSVLDHLRELWGPRFRRRTLMLWTVWFVMIGAFQGPVVWLPALLAAAGFAYPAEASLFVAVAMFFPTVAATFLIDSVGRKPVIISGLALGAGGAAGLAVARSEAALIVAGSALAGGVLAAWPVILAYAAELYPTRIRATATGWASAAGRLAGVLAPALLGLMMGSWASGRGPAVSVFAVALVIAALIIFFLGEETAGRSLEQVTEVAYVSPRGIIRQINVSSGGVPKHPVLTAHVGTEGLDGDGHSYRRHGGRARAISLFSFETITRLASEGHPIAPGTTGENLTVEGLDWKFAVPGARFRIGDVLLEITEYTTPCATIRGSFLHGEIGRIHQEHHPGESRVYARVLAEGTVRAGQTIEWIGGGHA